MAAYPFPVVGLILCSSQGARPVSLLSRLGLRRVRCTRQKGCSVSVERFLPTRDGGRVQYVLRLFFMFLGWFPSRFRSASGVVMKGHSFLSLLTHCKGTCVFTDTSHSINWCEWRLGLAPNHLPHDGHVGLLVDHWSCLFCGHCRGWQETASFQTNGSSVRDTRD